MSNAGYGNHDPSGPADAKGDAAGQKPPAGGQDRPGAGSGGSADESAAGAQAGSPRSSDRRETSTPGAGSLPDGGQGSETDPGTD